MSGRISRFIKNVLYFTAVQKCASCMKKLDKNEAGLCRTCLKKYEEAKMRNCSLCAKSLPECSCTNLYLSAHCVKGLSKLARYNGGVSREAMTPIIYRLKYKSRADVLDIITDDMVRSIRASLPPLPADTIITNVPNRKSAIRRRGFDHSEVLAKYIASKLSLEYTPLLKSLSKKSQKRLNSAERKLNAKFEPLHECDLRGKFIIIVDDVVTSGASMGNAAFVIRSLGAKDIYGATIAIAYRDEN